jgi:hypothetical protein
VYAEKRLLLLLLPSDLQAHTGSPALDTLQCFVEGSS